MACSNYTRVKYSSLRVVYSDFRRYSDCVVIYCTRTWSRGAAGIKTYCVDKKRDVLDYIDLVHPAHMQRCNIAVKHNVYHIPSI